jgi:O-glycosyl hydrolase
LFFALTNLVAAVTVSIDRSKEFQTIEGFGASINGWTAEEMWINFDPEFVNYTANELGLSIFRMQVWGGVTPHPLDNPEEIDYRDFRWRGPGMRAKANVDFARALVDANPEIRIIGSIWSPPGWMKENGSQEGVQEKGPSRGRNRLRDDHYEHFAKWVVEWARYMESQGTPFYALSLQNELLFDQWFESCVYTGEEYGRLVRVTGEMFEKEGVTKPLFFGPEDMTYANYSEVGGRHRPFVDALMQPDVAPYFDVFATHGYTDGVREDSTHNPAKYWDSIKQFGRPYWITEGGTGAHDWPAPIESGIAARLHFAIVESNVSLFCAWQISGADEGTQHDIVERVRPTPKTFATMHFWKHIRPGSIRIGTEVDGDADGLLASAYHLKAKNQIIVVLINREADEREITLDLGADIVVEKWNAWQTSDVQSHDPVQPRQFCGGQAVFDLPARSITTFTVDLVNEEE